jgi:hypothetical protein
MRESRELLALMSMEKNACFRVDGLMAAQKSVGGGSITHQPITQHEHT